MQKQILRDVCVLIVEDEPIQRESFVRDLDNIDTTLRLNLGINSFKPDLASSVEQAKAFLAAADSPYDILITDLGLPEKEGSTSNPPQNGQRLLESISRTKVKEVIIVSVFNDYNTVIKALRKGAVDFIAKPYLGEMLQTRVVESWKRVLEKDAACLIEGRIRELIHYVEQGVTHHFKKHFSHFIQLMIESVSDMEQYVDAHFRLNRKQDANDSLIRRLIDQQEALSRAGAMLDDLQPTSSRSMKSEIVEVLLDDIYQIAQPCLLVKGVELVLPVTPGVPVVTFQEDVRAILKEIIVGALSELPDYPDASNRIEVDVRIEDGWAEVCFIDNLPSMNADDVRRVNAGIRVIPDQQFRRAWGLSIMQNIAMYGGGRLRVEAQNGQENVITYQIPLASRKRNRAE